MGILDYFKRQTEQEQAAITPANDSPTDTEQRNMDGVLSSIGWGAPTAAGVQVTESNAMRQTAVYACVRILAETVASLPLIIYERQGDAKRRATELPLYSILHDRPNEWMTSFEFRETLMGHLALWGNAYAEIVSDTRGQIVALYPLRPDRMNRIVRLDDGRLAYQYQLPDGTLEWLSGDRVWHLRGISSDGVVGLSPIALLRQSIGLSMAAEEFGARFFGNGAHLGGVLEHPGLLGDQAYANLRETWQARQGGLLNAHRVAILEEGMRYTSIGIPPNDAQFLETRKFQVTEIARIFRVPPHMLADLERATFSNVEQQAIDFVVHTIRPWLVRWEQSINQNLMLTRERGRYFSEFLVDALLRGDTHSRYQAYAIGRQNGWLSANDIRNLENMNPIEGGNVYLVPLNMVPAEQMQNDESGMMNDGQRAHQPAQATHQGWEVRGRAVAAGRAALASDYVPLIADVMGRMVRRESADIGRQARKQLERRELSDFLLWLDDFYADHEAFVSRNILPVMLSLASAVARNVQAEVSNDAEINTQPFTEEYVRLYGVRYAAKQRKALIGVIQRAQEGEQDVLQAIEERLAEWEEVRPEQEGKREAERGVNALAVMAMGALGIRQKRWVTLRDSCPYCTQLNGVLVGTDQYFLGAGMAIEADGHEPLLVSSNMGHPPAHDGCDCMVIAGV